MRTSKTSTALPSAVSAVSPGEQEQGEETTEASSTQIGPIIQEHLTIVIKLGSSSIVNEDDFQPQLALLSSIVETVCSLRRKGHRVVLVSSGAIAMGLKRMEMRVKPKVLAEKQVSLLHYEASSAKLTLFFACVTYLGTRCNRSRQIDSSMG